MTAFTGTDIELINADSLGKPSGFTHAVRYGDTVHLSGQTALDATGRIVEGDIVDQFRQVLTNVLTALRAAGSEPADQVNPSAVAAMAEEGIDITAETPKVLTTDAVRASDVVITMGCGDTCPIFPGKRYEDWVLEDPAGKGVESVRPIRDEIEQRIRGLLAELGVSSPA